MSQNSNLVDDDAELGELFAGLWSNKLLVIIITGLSIFVSGYFAFTAEKKYTAKAIFQIEEKNNGSNLTALAEMGALATLAGVASGGVNSDSEILLERLVGHNLFLE